MKESNPSSFVPHPSSLISPHISLRPVEDADLPLFFENQCDPVAVKMAAFPARDWPAFEVHWAKIRSDDTVVIRTVVVDGEVVGSVGSWEAEGERKIGYWLGRAFWGRGIATAALAQFLTAVTSRPLLANVAKHNAGSIRVLQKCGFACIGESVVTDPDGESCPELIMRLEG